MSESFFTVDDDWYRPTDHTRGPWDPDACHAGPPTGLIARELERRAPDTQLVRLSVDLLRPIPFAGFRIETGILHEGRTLASTTAELLDADGRLCVRGSGLHIAPQDVEVPSNAASAPGGRLADAEPRPFPITRALHGLPGFNGPGVETRYPPGEGPEPGPTTVWMRTIPLLPDEVPSPFQRICPLADCGNAFGRNAEPWEVRFVNPDLTLVLHRAPLGEWLGSQAEGHWQPNGIGLADALLFDEHGPVGRALQTLVLRPA